MIPLRFSSIQANLYGPDKRNTYSSEMQQATQGRIVQMTSCGTEGRDEGEVRQGIQFEWLCRAEIHFDTVQPA
jgi:hypothetical protein